MNTIEERIRHNCFLIEGSKKNLTIFLIFKGKDGNKKRSF